MSGETSGPGTSGKLRGRLGTAAARLRRPASAPAGPGVADRVWRAYLVVLFVAALLHGSLYAVVVAPFDAPDENAHYEYARLLWELKRPPREEDRSPDLRAEVETLMRARGVGLPRRLPDGQVQLVFSSELGRQPPGYYALAALAYGLTRERSLPTQVLAMRLVSVAGTALVVVLAALSARLAFRREVACWFAAPLLVLFLPGLSFIGASINNDILAVLAVSLTTYGLLRQARHEAHGLTATVAGLALGLVAKRTAAAGFPLAALSWLASARLWTSLRGHPRRAAALGLAVFLLGAAVVVAATGPTDRPADWLTSPADAGRLAPEGRSGASALALDAPPTTGVAAMQYLDRQGVFRTRGQVVEAEVWARSAEGSALVSLLLGDTRGEGGETVAVGPTWTRLRATRPVAAGAPSVYLKVLIDDAAEARTVYVDDAWLAVLDPALPPQGEADLLRNGGFEAPAWELRPEAARLLRLAHLEPYVLTIVLNPERYSTEALEAYGFMLRFAFESFWARFGWLSIPVDRGWYDALLVAFALAVLGLPIAAVRWWRSADRSRADVHALAVLVLAAALTSATALLPYLSGALPQEWPQGRYLYPGVVPLALLTSLGLLAWLPTRLRFGGLLTIAGGLAAFDAACLVLYLLPHYYGA